MKVNRHSTPCLRIFFNRLLCCLPVLALLATVAIPKALAQTNTPVSVVDVMILYTPQARDSAGGDSVILSNIDLAMLEANSVMQNSHANVRFRLVHAGEIDYTESGSVTTDLTHLRNPADLNLGARASALREKYAADLVCLITETGNDYEFYGLQGPSAENAFSILRQPYLVGYNDLPVALSFNFGCQLERAFADSAGAFPYAYGYSFSTTNGSYSTVDAFSGHRLPFFSSPDIIFQGVPAGVPAGSAGGANNTLVLNHTAPVVAAFRGTAPTTLPPIVQFAPPLKGPPFQVPMGTNLMLLTTASDPDGFVSQVNFYRVDLNTGLTQFIGAATNAPFGVIWSNVPPGSWGVSVQAVDKLGASTRAYSSPLYVFPLNDNLTNATLLTGSNITITGTTDGATLENGESSIDGSGPSVWYSWIAPADGRLNLSMPGMAYGTFIGVFTGDVVTNLVTVANNALWIGNWIPAFGVHVTAGTTYQIEVAGQAPLPQFTLQLQFLPKPANDNFAQRTKIPANGGTVSAENVDATWETGEPTGMPPYGYYMGYTPSSKSVWWEWKAPADGQVSIQPYCDFTYSLGVFTGTVLTNLTALYQELNTGVAAFNVKAGTALEISVDGLNGGAGTVKLSVVFNPSPTNDNFTNAQVVSGVQTTLQGNNLAATAEPGEPWHAGVPASASVWWKWIAPVSGYFTLVPQTNAANFGMEVYTGTMLTNLTSVAATQSGMLGFPAVQGTTYFIAVDANNQYYYSFQGAIDIIFQLSTLRIVQPSNGAAFYADSPIVITATSTSLDGDGTNVDFFINTQWIGSAPRTNATISWTPTELGYYTLTSSMTSNQGVTNYGPPIGIRVRPANDDFANSFFLSGTNVSTNGTNLGAGAEPGEPTGGDPAATASVWYSWTAPHDGPANISLSENYYGGHALGLYTGQTVSNLTTLAESHSDQVWINAYAGITYRIEVTGETNAYGGIGDFSLTVNLLQPPLNDNFANRTLLSGSNIVFSGTNINATSEAGDPSSSPSVWWSWTAPADGSLYLTAQGNGLGPVITVYSGNTLTNLQAVGSAQPSWYYGTDSSGEMHVLGGVTYQLELTGTYDWPLGTAAIELSFVPSPGNDNFANRYILSGPQATSISSNVTATAEPGETNSRGHTVWWSWTPTNSGLVTIGTAGSVSSNPSWFPVFNPWLSVYTGTAVTNLVLVTNGSADVSFHATAGTKYKISADADSGGDTGLIQLSLFAELPPNDNFANRTTLAGTNVSVVGCTVGATEEPSEPVHGGFQGSNSIWYTWTAPANGLLDLSVTGDGFSPTWTVYTGSSLGSLSSLADSYILNVYDNYALSSASFQVQQGVSYQIAVDGSTQTGGRATGTVDVSLSLIPPPPNDNFANRTVIEGAWISLTNTDIAATAEPGEPAFAQSAGGNSIWWQWTAPASGQVTLTTSTTATGLGVFTGNVLSNLVLVATDNKTVTFQATAGTTYDIAAAGLPGNVDLQLLLSGLTLTSPTNGAVYFAGANVPLQVNLTPLEEPTVQVQYIANGVSLGVVSTAPYAFTWQKPGINSYWVTAVATDAQGHQHVSPGVSITVIQQPPANEVFTNAIVMTGMGTSINGTTIGANGNPVWYAWTAPAAGSVQLTLSAVNYWSQFAWGVYTGTNVTNLTVVTNGGDYTLYYPHSLTFYAQAGTTYYFNVSEVNNFTLQLTENISFASMTNATVLNGLPASASGVLTGPTTQFTNSGPLDYVWYSWTAPTNVIVGVSASGTNYVPPFVVYNETSTSNLAVQSVTAGQSNTAYFQATSGSNYFFMVYGSGESFTLNLSSALPANDNFALRQTLTGVEASVTGTLFEATTEPGEPAIPITWAGGIFGGNANVSVWYSWVAPADGVVEVSCPFQAIGVYTGPSVSNLVAVVPSGLNYLTFPAVAGTEYNIAVANLLPLPSGQLPVPDNFALSLVLPKAQFVTPTNGSVFPAPASFQVVARTIDMDGAVVSVTLYDHGTNLLGVATNSPFQFNFTNVLAGDYVLSLVATDQYGGVTTNVPIDVRVQPGNDNFAQRYVIYGTTNLLADNSGATTEPGETLPAAASGRTLWWTWQAPTNGTVTINTSGFLQAHPLLPPGLGANRVVASASKTTATNGNSKDVITIIYEPPPPYPPGPTTGPSISVYTNSAITNLSLCASNVAWYPYAGLGESPWYLVSSLTFSVVAGQTYQISLDGLNGSYGLADISFIFTPPPPPPANDNFAGRTMLYGSRPYAYGNTISATVEPGEPMISTNTNACSVWYSWTAPSSGDVNINEDNGFDFSNWGSTFNLGVFTGSQLTNLSTVSTGTGSVSFYAQAGTTYQISVSSLSGLQTNFYLNLYGPPPPPALQSQNSGRVAGNQFHLSVGGSTGQGVVIQASTDLVNWETVDVDTMLGTNLDFMDADMAAYPQRYYRVLPLSAFFDSPSAGSLAPANDSFSHRTMLTGTSAQISGNNEFATSEMGEWLSDGASGRTLWWSWTAPTNATVTLTATTNEFANLFGAATTNDPLYLDGPLVSVFKGDALVDLVLVGSNSVRSTMPGYYGSDAGPMLVQTNFTFEAAAGVTYNIAVDGCNGSAGAFDLSFSAVLHPAFFNGEVALDKGVYWLTFGDGTLFGYYNYKWFPTLYHYDLGFEYFMDAHDGKQGAYLYDFASGHYWFTSPKLFPYLYDFSLNAWLYYYSDTQKAGHYTTNPRYFYNFGAGKIITL